MKLTDTGSKDPRWRRLLPSVLQILSIGSQAALFYQSAKYLGPMYFALFSSVSATINIALPFVSLGYGNFLIYRVASVGGSSIDHTKRYFAIVGVTALAISPLVFATIELRGQVSDSTATQTQLLTYIVLEMLCVKLIDAPWHIEISSRRPILASLLLLGYSVSKNVGAFAVQQLNQNISLDVWLKYHAVPAWFFAGVVSTYYIVRSKSNADSSVGSLGGALRIGSAYAMALSSKSLLNDYDKTRAPECGLALGGGYTVVCRLAQMLTLPAQVLVSASLPNLIEQLSRNGPVGALGMARRALLALGAYGLMAGASVILVAEWVIPLILPEYSEVVQVAWMLALLPISMLLSAFLAEICGAVGNHWIRTLAFFFGGCTSVFLIDSLVRPMGVVALVIGVYSGQLILLILSVFGIFLAFRAKRAIK